MAFQIRITHPSLTEPKVYEGDDPKKVRKTARRFIRKTLGASIKNATVFNPDPKDLSVEVITFHEGPDLGPAAQSAKVEKKVDKPA